MVWYDMVNVDLYSAIITKVSNALDTHRHLLRSPSPLLYVRTCPRLRKILDRNNYKENTLIEIWR